MFRGMIGRFFIGRNGVDALAKFYLVIASAFIVVTLLTGNAWIYLVGIFVLICSYFRIISKNIPKRHMENQAFLRFVRRFFSFFKNLPWKIRARFTESLRRVKYGSNERQEKRRQAKIYRFFVCPSCGQKVRVPRGKGKIEITCPKCTHAFVKRS